MIKTGIAIDSQDEEGQTALHYAVDRGHISLIRSLLAHGANPQIKVLRTIRVLTAETESGDSAFDYVDDDNVNALKIREALQAQAT
jgi:ankyrin repeat protein